MEETRENLKAKESQKMLKLQEHKKEQEYENKLKTLNLYLNKRDK